MPPSAIQLTCQACSKCFILRPDNLAGLTRIHCPSCKAVYMDLEALRERLAVARKRTHRIAEQMRKEFQAHWDRVARSYWRDFP